MEQVNPAAGAAIRVQRGHYTEGALARTPFSDLRIQVGTATQNVVGCERRHEDLERPVTMAIAGRDLVGLGLDDAAANVRLQLVSRSRYAFREQPVTDIFERGTDQYTGAKVDEKAEAFGLLISRIEAHLPPEDPVRVEFVPVITALLVEWNAAVGVIVGAEKELDLARQLRDNALVDWDAAMVEVYGLLVSRVGKKRADRYFFRAKTRRTPIVPGPTKSAEPASEETTTPPATEAAEAK